MNIKRKYKTIESRISNSIIVFTIILFLVIWIFFYLFFNVYYAKYQLEQVYNIKEKILDDKKNIAKTANTYDVCILKFEDNVVTNQYNINMDGCALLKGYDKVKNIIIDFAKNDRKEKLYNFHNEEKKVDASLLAFSDEKEDIFIYTNLKDYNYISFIFLNQMIFLTSLFIILSILFGYFISRKIIEPLNFITNNAKYIGTKNETTFKKSGYKEIDDLVDTLNLAQSEIGKTNKLKRDLMANVSHDFKTPLTMMRAYAEMARDLSFNDKKKIDDCLDIIINESDRLNLLVNDILNMSKMQDGKESLNIEKFDLCKVVNEVIKGYSIIKETGNYEFITSMPKSAIISGDIKKIKQIVYNIINNAINYTGENKKVYINIKKRVNVYSLEIKDTGEGINESDICKIWDQYYKTEKRHKRNVVSSGLGLSIVKEICILHKIEYGVKTSKKGSTFYFIFK